MTKKNNLSFGIFRICKVLQQVSWIEVFFLRWFVNTKAKRKIA